MKDETQKEYGYEMKEYPECLKEISKNIKLGIDELKKRQDVNWTVVCPSEFFDSEGGFTGNYDIFTDGHLHYDHNGQSRVTYDDLAAVMIGIAKENTFSRQQICVLSK